MKCVFTLIAISPAAQAGGGPMQKDDTLNLLFVQDAQGVEFNNDKITLKQTKPRIWIC